MPLANTQSTGRAKNGADRPQKGERISHNGRYMVCLVFLVFMVTIIGGVRRPSINDQVVHAPQGTRLKRSTGDHCHRVDPKIATRNRYSFSANLFSPLKHDGDRVWIRELDLKHFPLFLKTGNQALLQLPNMSID